MNIKLQDPEETDYYRVHQETTPTGVGLRVQRLKVVRRTEKGVWLDTGYKQQFTLNEGKKRYAYPTLTEAYESFIARKVRQVKILRSQLDAALDAGKLASEELRLLP